MLVVRVLVVKEDIDAALIITLEACMTMLEDDWMSPDVTVRLLVRKLVAYSEDVTRVPCELSIYATGILKVLNPGPHVIDRATPRELTMAAGDCMTPAINVPVEIWAVFKVDMEADATVIKDWGEAPINDPPRVMVDATKEDTMSPVV